MTAILTTNESGTLLVLQQFRPDPFFTAEQQSRLQDLMSRWREARDRDGEMLPAEQAELEALVAAETVAAGHRAAELNRDVRP